MSRHTRICSVNFDGVLGPTKLNQSCSHNIFAFPTTFSAKTSERSHRSGEETSKAAKLKETDHRRRRITKCLPLGKKKNKTLNQN